VVHHLLKKLILTVRHCGLLFRERQDRGVGEHGWQWWKATGLPIAAVFGHGGRLMIQDESTDKRFTKWLLEDIWWQKSWRVSTHGMKVLNDEILLHISGESKRIKEVKKKMHSSKGLDAACYGVNNTNPHTGDRVSRNGKFGHFCIVSDKKDWMWKAGRHRVKGTLIGLEGSGPMHKDTYGGTHGPSGVSGEFSPTGSQKWRYLHMGPGCRYIDSDDGRIFRGKFYNPENPRKKWEGTKIGGLKDYNPPVADTLLICVNNDKYGAIIQEDRLYNIRVKADHNMVKALLRKTVAVPDALPNEASTTTLINRYQAIMGGNYLNDSDADYQANPLPVPGPPYGNNPKWWLTRPPVTHVVPDDSGGRRGYPTINQIDQRAAKTPHFVKDRKTINSFIKVVKNWPLDDVRRLARGLEVYGQIDWSEDQKAYIRNRVQRFLLAPDRPLTPQQMSKMEKIDFSAWYEIHRRISGF